MRVTLFMCICETNRECPDFTAVRAVGQVLRTQTLTIRCCSLAYVKTSHILGLSDLNIVTAELI
jgi:ABC-type microcin C transport system permease subunit YejE